MTNIQPPANWRTGKLAHLQNVEVSFNMVSNLCK
jgi:hypothetical protein